LGAGDRRRQGHDSRRGRGGRADGARADHVGQAGQRTPRHRDRRRHTALAAKAYREGVARGGARGARSARLRTGRPPATREAGGRTGTPPRGRTARTAGVHRRPRLPTRARRSGIRMSTLQVADLPDTRADPFASATPGSIPRRPRLLSYVGRWRRARRWLPADALRVLDLGCAFGYGSAAVIARRPPGRTIVGRGA